MRVYVRLAAHLRGQVGGLCGNFDGDTENDFTTRQGIVESTPELFGNSWKVSPSCPDVANQDLRDPCAVSAVLHINMLSCKETMFSSATLSFQLNPYRVTWARKRCAVLTQELFSVCHHEVPFQQYYDWCVFDACGWVTALINLKYCNIIIKPSWLNALLPYQFSVFSVQYSTVQYSFPSGNILTSWLMLFVWIAVTRVETVSVSVQPSQPMLRSATGEGSTSAGGLRSSAVCYRHTDPHSQRWCVANVPCTVYFCLCVTFVVSLCSSAVWEWPGLWSLWTCLLSILSQCSAESTFPVWCALLCGGLLLPRWHCTTR